MPIEIMQRWKMGLKCRLGGPCDPWEKSSTIQIAKFRLTWIKGPIGSTKPMYQMSRHVEQ